MPNIDDLLKQFVLQQRPYVTIAESLDLIYRDLLVSTGIPELQVAPLVFTVLQMHPNGKEHIHWLLGFDAATFKLILANKQIFIQNADLVFNKNLYKKKLDIYYKDVLDNPEKYDDIEFLTAVFHLTYSFNIPVCFNVGLIHREHKKRLAFAQQFFQEESGFYRARLCLDQKSDSAGIPPLAIEAQEPLFQVNEYWYDTEYRHNEAFYRDWTATIQGMSLSELPDYKYIHHLYYPIYNSYIKNISTICGYLGIFFADENSLNIGLDYFNSRKRIIEREIYSAYKKGTRISILDNYDWSSVDSCDWSDPDPIRYWIKHFYELCDCGKVTLQKGTIEGSKMFSLENGICSISLERILNRRVIKDYVDSELQEKYCDKILLLEIPQDIIELKQPDRISLYLRHRVDEIIRLLDDLLKKHHILSSEEKVKKAHRKSAVSAIMSRNLSHNVGSHVLTRLSTPKECERRMGADANRKIALLNSFLRTRMNFLADLSTSTPFVTTSFAIYRDAIGYLRPAYYDEGELPWQELLMDYISGIESLKSHNIDIKFVKDGVNLCLEQSHADPLFASPNGLLGIHALYIILENIIRNSAKHAYDPTETKRLEITCLLSESTEHQGFLEARVYDNLGNANATKTVRNTKMNLVDYLNSRLQISILNIYGELRSEAWGILEMKICAAYLRRISPEVLDARHTPGLLEAFSFNNNLAFRFYLPRPKAMVIYDEDGAISGSKTLHRQLKSYGVDILGDKDFQELLTKNIEHDFLILVNPAPDVLAKVQKQRRSLPIRIFTTDPAIKSFPFIKIDEIKFFSVRGTADIQKKVLNLWQKWLKVYADNTTLIVRSNDEYVLQKWNIYPISETFRNPADFKNIAQESKFVIYDRHGDIARNDEKLLSQKIGDNQVIYYEDVQHNKPTSFIINNASDNAMLNESTALELIESGSTKVIILDERIQKNLEERDENSVNLKDALSRMNIKIPLKFPIDLDDPKNCCKLLEAWLHKTLPDARFLVIHLGILEKIHDDNLEKMAAEIERWESKFPNLEITLVSGRGLPQALKKLNARFLHYSQIARFVLEERSKYHLCKVLFASRRAI